MSKKKIAFIIPAFNESSAIVGVLNDLKKELKNTSIPYEIVVVDDGSKDNTAELATNEGVTVIKHVLNTGSGGATATGLSYAQQNGFDYAVTLDADGQHKALDAINGVKIAQEINTDLLIGSRLINPDGMSKVKLLGNKGLSTITFLIFGVSVTDSQSGLRIFSKKALEQLRWKTSGFEFCSEMLWRAKQLKLVIKEYPIEAIYTEYSKAKGQNNWNAFNIIKSLLKRRMIEVFGE